MLKKLKRILSLSIVTAMIMSLVGVLPVMAEEAGPTPGEHQALFINATNESALSNKIAKTVIGTTILGDDGETLIGGLNKAVVNEDDTIDLYLQLTDYAENLVGIYFGSYSDSSEEKEAGIIEAKAETADSLPQIVIKDYKSKLKEGFLNFTYKTYSSKSGSSWAKKDIKAKITITDGIVVKEPTSVKTAKVTIYRVANFEMGNETVFDKGVYVLKYNDEEKSATVKMYGNYTEMYYGKYTDAEKATKDTGLISLKSAGGYTDIEIKGIEFEQPITISLHQSSMDKKWREYSFTFSKGECDHTYADGICSKCGAVDKTNKDHFVVGEKEVAIKSDKNTSVVITKEAFADTADKAVALETKAGTVTFDAKAFAAIVGASETDITFEMNNIKDTPLFAKSKYDVVLDLSIKDANGTPLFATAGNGKATVTVPYDKEVPEGKKVAVFYITDEGREEVEAKYDAETKTISFEVEHFSTYAVQQVDDTTTANVTNTGDSSQMIFVVIALFASLLVSGAAFNKKRNYI